MGFSLSNEEQSTLVKLIDENNGKENFTFKVFEGQLPGYLLVRYPISTYDREKKTHTKDFKFYIAKNKPMGSGHYGAVYKAFEIDQEKNIGQIPYALKKQDNQDAAKAELASLQRAYFKTALQEK